MKKSFSAIYHYISPLLSRCMYVKSILKHDYQGLHFQAYKNKTTARVIWKVYVDVLDRNSITDNKVPKS